MQGVDFIPVSLDVVAENIFYIPAQREVIGAYVLENGYQDIPRLLIDAYRRAPLDRCLSEKGARIIGQQYASALEGRFRRRLAR